MVKRHHAPKTEDLGQAMAKYPHLRKYVEEVSASMGQPEWVLELNKNMRGDTPSYLYPVGDPIFVHVYRDHEKGKMVYNVIEPRLTEEEEKLYDRILDKMIDHAHKYKVPNHIEDAGDIIEKIFKEVVKISDKPPSAIDGVIDSKIHLTQLQHDNIWYYVYRNRVGYGKMEPFFYDPYLEDIHCTGVGNIKTIHKIFDMVYTNVEFKDDIELNKYILDASERVERPVSDANSVVDAIMPDGSRVNFIYGRELSLEGSSFTVRKFSEVPVSIIQIVNWGTMSAEVAAYLWLCLENGMNIFVCGETASGKTTTLNASAAFIKPDDKVYTVENTPEVTMPQETWQHLVTREAGKDTDVTMFTLLIAALRSRPNYIIVGEIRGEEGNVAFQAMQCVREGTITIPGRGPVDIKTLYQENAPNAKKEDGKRRADLSEQHIPVLVSEKDGKITRSHITNVFRMEKQELITVDFDTGERLEVTPKHQFITEHHQEIRAQELLVTDGLSRLLLPKSVPWSNTNASGYALLEGHTIQKPAHFTNVWKQYAQSKEYTKTRLQHEDVFKTRTQTIPYTLYKQVCTYTRTQLPAHVNVVRKGAKKRIRVDHTIPQAVLKAAARKLLGEITAYDDYLTHILGVHADHVSEQFWKLGKQQLRIVFEELKARTQTTTQPITDALWYSIGRLAGDDSLYLTKTAAGSAKDFRWQIKNANTDEGVRYANTAKNVIPHKAARVTTKQEGNTYTTRIVGVDRSFVDFLVKQGFISINEEATYSKAVRKYIPENIANPYAYLAGLLDSDCTIRKTTSRGHEIKLALNINRDHEQLLFDQISFIKRHEHTLLPELLGIEFRYHRTYATIVKRYATYCEDKGIRVRLTQYDKQKGIGARAEFSTDKKQQVFALWQKHVAPYMYREDKKKVIAQMAEQRPVAQARVLQKHYPVYACFAHKNVLPHLSLIARIFGETLITENHECFTKKGVRFEKKKTMSVLRAAKGATDYTYDISMQEGTYYIGGRNTTGYIYDTGHPVMSTFHAGNPHTMIQRLTGHPINVPIASIDNLNIVLIQQAVSHGGRMVRRVLSITEIERYYDAENKVITREVFSWDPVNDVHRFRGLYNSYILEKKIAAMLGYADTRDIYNELDRRKRIIERMVEEEIWNYFDVWEILSRFQKEGEGALPFVI